MRKRQCVKCKKILPVSRGKLMLRGISFVCNSCYKKEKARQKKSNAKKCDFC